MFHTSAGDTYDVPNDWFSVNLNCFFLSSFLYTIATAAFCSAVENSKEERKHSEIG